MSAYIVEDACISRMLSAVEKPGSMNSYWFKDETRFLCRDTAQILLAQNYRSVNYRYGDSDVPHIYTRPIKDADCVQTLASLACYEYQASESPDYEESEAHAIVTALRYRAITGLIERDGIIWG